MSPRRNHAKRHRSDESPTVRSHELPRPRIGPWLDADSAVVCAERPRERIATGLARYSFGDRGDRVYGAVEVDKKGKVIDFEEKPPKWKSTLISIGLYYWGRQHVGLFKQYLDEGQKKDQPGYFLQWAHRKIDVYGHVIDGEWYDIGDIDSYNTANEILMKGTPA